MDKQLEFLKKFEEGVNIDKDAIIEIEVFEKSETYKCFLCNSGIKLYKFKEQEKSESNLVCEGCLKNKFSKLWERLNILGVNRLWMKR